MDMPSNASSGGGSKKAPDIEGGWPESESPGVIESHIMVDMPFSAPSKDSIDNQRGD